MKQINILDLHRSINEKKMRTNECFDKILDICHKKIQAGADSQKMNCFIEVPSYVFGYPIFNFNNCIEYVYNSLKKNGFLVKYYFPKYLYVSWDFEEINENKRAQRTQQSHPQYHPQYQPQYQPQYTPARPVVTAPINTNRCRVLGTGGMNGESMNEGGIGCVATRAAPGMGNVPQKQLYPPPKKAMMKGTLSYKPSGKLSLDLS